MEAIRFSQTWLQRQSAHRHSKTIVSKIEAAGIHPLGSSIVSITIIGIADVVIEIITRTVRFQHLNHRRIAECQITTITELTGGAGSGEE